MSSVLPQHEVDRPCVCMCMCVFMYVYIYIYTYIHTRTHTHTRRSKLMLWQHLRHAFFIFRTKYQLLHYLCQGKISRPVPQTLNKKAGVILRFMSRKLLLDPHFAHSQGTSHIVRRNIHLIPTPDKAFV